MGNYLQIFSTFTGGDTLWKRYPYVICKVVSPRLDYAKLCASQFSLGL